MKKLALGILAILVAVALFLAFRQGTLKGENPAELLSAPATSLATPVSEAIVPAVVKTLPSEAALSAESRKAVQECLGQEAATWEDIDNALLARASGPAHLQWKLASVEEDGQELRLRLAPTPLESGEAPLRLQIFSVDKEGLPDLQAARSGQDLDPARWMENFVAGKTLLRRASREDYPLPGNGTYERETENGQLTEARAQLGGKELDCGRRSENAGCLCRSFDDQGEEE